MRITLCVTLALVLCAGCSTAPTEPAPEPRVFTEAEKAQMTPEEKLAAYNEEVEEHDDIIICSKEPITGSHKKRRVCRTIGERRRDREDAQQALQDVAGDVGTALDPGGIN